MNRTTRRLCSAALVASGILLGEARGAHAQADVSNDAIRCSTVTATISARPSLIAGVIRIAQDAGLATSVAFQIKGKLSGCVDLTTSAVRIDSGTFRGTIVGTTNDCNALTTVQPAVGSLSYRWKANPATPILQRTSSQSVSTLAGAFLQLATMNPAFGGTAYLSFTLGTGLVTGAFSGGDAGATSSNALVTSESNRSFAVSCNPPASLKTIHIGVGVITLR